MSAETARQFEALERQASRLMAVFLRAGCEAVAPAVIQPADVFLDVVGEDLRSRTYVFTDPEGRELCLRPDLTVPTCRLHLAREPTNGTVAHYCYNGPAFRFQPINADAAHPNEFRQAGIELIGDSDLEAAETRVLALVLEALRAVGIGPYRVRIGDLGLFHALLQDLGLPEHAKARLLAQFRRPEAFRTALTRLTLRQPDTLPGIPPDLAARLGALDIEAAETAVVAHMEKAGIPMVGARSPAEIARALLDTISAARMERVPDATAQLIERYLAIAGPADLAANELSGLISGCGERTRLALKRYGRRLQLISEAGIDPSSIDFAAEFGRNLEYYTGFVFDIVTPRLGPATPIAGGGRYDGLMRAVGYECDLPAVGSAIHTERLLAVVGGGAP